MSTGVLTSQTTALQKKQIYFSPTVLRVTFLPDLPGEVCQPSLPPVISDPQWISFSRLEPTAQNRPERPQFDWKEKQPLFDSERLKFSPGISCPRQSIINQCPQRHLLNQTGTSTLETLLLRPKKVRWVFGNLQLQGWRSGIKLESRLLAGVPMPASSSLATQERYITFSSLSCRFPCLRDFS